MYSIDAIMQLPGLCYGLPLFIVAQINHSTGYCGTALLLNRFTARSIDASAQKQ
jgi:hypothetical protein